MEEMLETHSATFLIASVANSPLLALVLAVLLSLLCPFFPSLTSFEGQWQQPLLLQR